MSSRNQDQRLKALRSMWRYVGDERPSFADSPAPGQESVWDYPRPPAVVQDSRSVEVKLGNLIVARSSHALRVLETASPPTFYVPHHDVNMAVLTVATGGSFCEWKGRARYYDLHGPTGPTRRCAWTYDEPLSPYEALTGHLSFYPSMLQCFVDAERVRPQPGGFYGGWVTHEITGPFKGEPGTGKW